MTTKIILILMLAISLSACKVLKTHIVKLTASAELQQDAVMLSTNKGRVYFSAQQMTEKQKNLLMGLRPFQCLEIKTPEQFDMENREVKFTDFKLKSLVESHRECKKLKLTRRIEVH